jgi:NADH-quinone oxidoreductase subunit J
MPLDNVVFWVFAPISIASAIGMLLVRNAVHAALFLVVNFFCLAVFYLLLDAPFLFAVQIVVYAGAIMVLFLFVIMLLGVDRDESLVEHLRAQRPLAIVLGLAVDTGVSVRERLLVQRPLAFLLGAAFVVELFLAIRAGVGFATKAPEVFTANEGGNTQAVAKVLFTSYFFPFEVTSILLLVAAIAAMVLAHRRARAVTQAEIDAAAGDDEPPAYEAGAAS